MNFIHDESAWSMTDVARIGLYSDSLCEMVLLFFGRALINCLTTQRLLTVSLSVFQSVCCQSIESQFLAHSMNELMQSRGVRRPSVRLSVCPSVNFYTQVATSTTNMTRSPPNLHKMVPTWAYIQGVLKVKVKVKGHVIRTLF